MTSIALLLREKGTEQGRAVIFGSKRIKAKMKLSSLRFEANKKGVIRLFRIEANRRILHA
jgi:hypothetical protein